MHLGEFIKQYRDKNGMSMSEFAKKSGISKAYVSVLEKNKDPRNGKPIIPSIPIIKKVSDAISLPFDELFILLDNDQIVSINETETEKSSKLSSNGKDVLRVREQKNNIISIYNQLQKPRQKKVYHYAERQLEEQNAQEERSIYVVGQSTAGAPLAYGDLDVQEISMANIPANADKALTIKGDSMEPLITDGSIVFYKEQPSLENGEIGIFEVNGDSVTCKKLKVDYENKKIHLQSLNDKYEDMVFDDEDVKVLGKVIV